MKRLPLQLKIGGLILLVLLLMALFPTLFTRQNPYATETLRYQTDAAGRFIMQRAPFPPQWDIPLGSDEMGRQLWPLIVHGTRLTLLLAMLVVAGRFLLALPVGFAAGFGSVTAQAAIRQFSVIFGTIPALLLSVIVLKMDFFTGLGKVGSIFSFVVVLTTVGWGRLGLVIQTRVKALLQEPFVLGEAAIGKSRLQIALGTVLHHLLPELFILFFLEMNRALTLLMQLGIFAVFVGNVRFIEDTDGGIIKVMNMSYEPEWASILGAARNNLRSAPWTVLFPALAFFVSVMGLNAFGEGLRELLQDRTEPFRYSWRNAPMLRRAVAVLLILTLGVYGLPALYRGTLYRYDADVARELPLAEAPVVIGSSNAADTAAWLAEELRERGLQPLNSKTYIHAYPVGEATYPLGQQAVLTSGGSSPRTLVPDREYRMITYGTFSVEAPLLDYRLRDLYQLTADAVSEPGVLLLDAEYYTPEAVRRLSERLSEIPNVRGLVWLDDVEAVRPQEMGAAPSPVPALYLDRSLSEEAETGCLRITMTSAAAGGTGRNVLACLPGSDPRTGEEAILYGFSYNGMTPEETRLKLAYALAFVDALERDPNSRKRTILVAFFDGTLADPFSGVGAYAAESPYSQKNTLLYVDMTRLRGIPEGVLTADQKQSPITRYFAYTFAVQAEQRLTAARFIPEPLQGETEADSLLFRLHGTPTLIYGLRAPEPGEKTLRPEALGRLLVGTLSANNY